jgi:hypothetical protein
MNSSVGTKPKKHYVRAVSIGTAVGLFIALVFAIFGGDGFPEIPFWDWGDLGPDNFRPGTSLNLQFTAVLLRLCMVLLDNGFSFITFPIAAAVLLERHSEKTFVKTVYHSLVLTFLAYFCVWIIFAVGIVTSPSSYSDYPLIEKAYTAIFVFILGLVLLTANGWLLGFFLSFLFFVQPFMWREFTINRKGISFSKPSESKS